MKHPLFAIADSLKNRSCRAIETSAQAGLTARAVDRAYATAPGLKGSDPFPTDRARVEHLFALYERLTTAFLPAIKAKRARK